MYFKSRTDLDIVQTPTLGVGPAGSSVMDPDFQNQIIRATDENTGNGLCYGAGIDGSADVNIWNTNSTLLYLHDGGGAGAIFRLDPDSLSVARVYPAWRVPGCVIFSRLDPTVAFQFTGTQFWRYDFSDTTTPMPPSPVLVCDFASQLPRTFTWNTVGGVESADTVFTAAFSVSGPQGTGVYACAFSAGQGYRTYNTATGIVAGDFGPVGLVTVPDRFTIHNVKQSKDGSTLVIGKTTQMSGSDLGPYFWTVATNAVSPMSHVAQGSHWTDGYGDFFNNSSSPTIPHYAYCRRLLTALDSPWRVASQVPDVHAMLNLDDHPSYNGEKDGMLITTTTSAPSKTIPPAPYPAAWWDEVIGYDLQNGKVYRFCHHFSNTHSGNFNADNAIGCGDQLNTLVAFTSNWQSTLANGRYDAFIVKLR